jgi:hypothetical protein
MLPVFCIHLYDGCDMQTKAAARKNAYPVPSPPTSSDEFDDFVNLPQKKQHLAKQAQQSNLNVPEDVLRKKGAPQTLKPQQKKVRTHNVSMLHPLHNCCKQNKSDCLIQ